MDQRKSSIQFLRATGLIPVVCNPKSKDPDKEWDCRNARKQNHEHVLRRLADDPSLNIAGLFCDKFVDVDVDNDNPYVVQALDHFLPPTNFTWGRPAKPASHRAYMLHDNFDRGPFGPKLRFLKDLVVDNVAYKIEVRGGKPEANFYTVLPGSIHPSGEEYQWKEGNDPTMTAPMITIGRLMRAVRLATATAMVCQYWVSGSRNDMSLALAGLLWRIRASSLSVSKLDEDEEPEDTLFILSKSDAYALFEAVLKFADDKVSDHRARRINFENTWKKLDADPSAKVTGGKVFAELIGDKVGDEVVKSLYRLLSDNEGIEQLEALADQFCVWYRQGMMIDLDLVEKGLETPWMSREQLANSLGGKAIIIGDKKKRIADMLWDIPIIERVYGLTFNPATLDRIVDTDQGKMVNQWRGWATEACPQAVVDSQVQPFLDYIYEVIADNNEIIYKWVLAWLADIFQNPASKCKTALVLVGKPGAGKSFLGEHLIGAIIGEQHEAAISDVAEITTRFNTSLDNKIFVRCEEAVHAWQKDMASKLKSIITDNFYYVEPKNVNKIRKPNHMRFVFTSNEKTQALLIDPDPTERRYTVLEVSSKRISDLKYWDGMHKWAENNKPILLRWLIDYQYEKKLIMRPIDTEAKRRIQRVGVDTEVSWIVSRIASGHILSECSHTHWWQAFNSKTITETEKEIDTLQRDTWPDTVSLGALEDDYRAFVRSHGKTVHSGSIITNLKRVLPPSGVERLAQISVKYVDERSGQITKDRIRLYSLPPADEILEHLRDTHGSIIDKILEEAQESGKDDIVVKSDDGEF